MTKQAVKPTKWLGEASAEIKNRHELRRDTILIAAARCFTKLGYHRTTLDDIARELGVSKAAVYYYATSKEQIYLECNEAAVETGLHGLDQADALVGTAADKLKLALRWYIENATDRTKGHVVLYEAGTLPPELHRRLAEKRDAYEYRLRRLVQQGIEEGVFEPCDVKLIIFSLLGSISWVSKWFSPDGERSSSEVADILSNHLVRGLLKGTASSTGRKLLARQPHTEGSRRVRNLKQ
jgi:TetR/AcrR family transcriptional regulator